MIWFSQDLLGSIRNDYIYLSSVRILFIQSSGTLWVEIRIGDSMIKSTAECDLLRTQVLYYTLNSSYVGYTDPVTIHVEYIHMIGKMLSLPPLQMMNLARKWTKSDRHHWKRCTGESIVISVVFQKECLSWCVVVVRFGILCRIVDNDWQTCLSWPWQKWRILPQIKWPLIVPLSWTFVVILGIFWHKWNIL